MFYFASTPCTLVLKVPPKQEAAGIWACLLYFLFLSGYNTVLTVVQFLKTVASYCFSSFVIDMAERRVPF